MSLLQKRDFETSDTGEDMKGLLVTLESIMCMQFM